MTIMGRFQTRKNSGAGVAPLGNTLFLCPKSVLSPLKNLPFWWIRLLEQFRYTASETNMKFHRQKYQTFRGGLSLNNGASHMHSYTPNFPKINTPNLSVSLKCFFIRLNTEKPFIVLPLRFKQAKPLAKRFSGFLQSLQLSANNMMQIGGIL